MTQDGSWGTAVFEAALGERQRPGPDKPHLHSLLRHPPSAQTHHRMAQGHQHNVKDDGVSPGSVRVQSLDFSHPFLPREVSGPFQFLGKFLISIHPRLRGRPPHTPHYTGKTNKRGNWFHTCTLIFTGGSDRVMQFFRSAGSRARRTPLFALPTTAIVRPAAGAESRGWMPTVSAGSAKRSVTC